MVILLLFAIVVSLIAGEVIDAVAIIAIVLIENDLPDNYNI